MSSLLYLGGVILFILGVAVSIGLHEMGHLIPGKLYNVKITQYFIGFGRTIWSRQRGETEYGLKAVPLGGYVKLVGMLPPGPDEDPDTVKSRPTGMFSQLISDARAAEYEHVGAHDHAAGARGSGSTCPTARRSWSSRITPTAAICCVSSCRWRVSIAIPPTSICGSVFSVAAPSPSRRPTRPTTTRLPPARRKSIPEKGLPRSCRAWLQRL